jgi:NAD(P)H-hydrate epimerase
VPLQNATESSHPRPELGPNQEFADRDFATRVLPHRSYGAHKWGVGGLLVVAGSPQYTGAAVMTCRAACRAGAGIVVLASGRSVVSVSAHLIPDVPHIALPEADSTTAAKRAVDALTETLGKSKAVLVGPGLGQDDTTDTLLGALFGFGPQGHPARASIGFSDGPRDVTKAEVEQAPLFASELPVVLDADALNWLAGQQEWWTKLPNGRAILTPHPGEMGRLLSRSPKEIIADPLKTVTDAAREWGQTVVLKYGYTAVSDGTRTIIAEDAPVSLATAGSGDVFAGMIGGFVAQGLAPLDAVGLALHVGPRAARKVEQRFGTLGLIASDLPDAIAEVLGELQGEQPQSQLV